MQEAISKQTDIKMTVRKIRRVINLIRGKKVSEAQRMLKYMPYFAARIVEKNLNAAIANAMPLPRTDAEFVFINAGL